MSSVKEGLPPTPAMPTLEASPDGPETWTLSAPRVRVTMGTTPSAVVVISGDETSVGAARMRCRPV
jgi:hypothetical protein